MVDREALLVELVDERGNATGAATVAAAHTPPGRLHRAFSVLLFDGNGRTLLQRRAPGKTRFPWLWSNACCGHPGPGQDLLAAAAGRLTAELGLVAELREVGTFTYHAADRDRGRVEREWDHVLVGALSGGSTVAADPAEVCEWGWVAPERLAAALAADPAAYTPWLPAVLRIGSDRWLGPATSGTLPRTRRSAPHFVDVDRADRGIRRE